uniref:DEAD/DEAH box helicase family protein n=1 Tax=Ruminococcus flavefaciens TaxID=1265 RepID=UPI0013DD5096
MEGYIDVYIKDDHIEVMGEEFLLGELTVDLLNIDDNVLRQMGKELVNLERLAEICREKHIFYRKKLNVDEKRRFEIQSDKADVVTTIINKFNTAENQKIKINDRNIFVLVDESHRSNYGTLATKMRIVFPCGCYIGFTGTPLMKKEKSTVGRFGGGDYIHKYTIKDAVDDKAIVPLIYEGRFVDQKVDEDNIDLWFEKTTRRLNEREREDLKQKWSSIKRLTSTDARIRRIALDIEEHFTDSVKNTGMKAMLATNFKRDAVRYLEVFEQLGSLNCAVVISAPDMREGEDDILSE